MSRMCEQLVAAARYLEAQGMSVQQLRALHHPQKQPETFASTYGYFGKYDELGAKNRLYAERLIFVSDEHRKGSGGIASLVHSALIKWPL